MSNSLLSKDGAATRVAIVYDRVNTPFGGAENVLLALHQIFPKAPLFTSVYDARRAKWAADFQVKTSFLQRFPFAKQMHRLFVPLMPLAFESLDLSAYDLVISVTSAEAKGVLTKPNQLHLCYLLTPTRYLWSHRQEYEHHWLSGGIRRLFFAYLRWWDQMAALRPDVIIPISELVARRCREYYLREPEKTIYPTVGKELEESQLSTSTILPAFLQPFIDHYYLIVARLVPYKKIDLAIHACQKAQKPLVIIGRGPDFHRLKNLAKTGPKEAPIFFFQAVQPAQLPAYYAHCKAFLAPAEEDFGMTVIEAQRFGKPVVVYSKSGGAEVVEEGRAGIYFFAQTVNDLSEAIQITEKFSWDHQQIQQKIRDRSQANFRRDFQKAVEYHWQSFLAQY